MELDCFLCTSIDLFLHLKDGTIIYGCNGCHRWIFVCHILEPQKTSKIRSFGDRPSKDLSRGRPRSLGPKDLENQDSHICLHRRFWAALGATLSSICLSSAPRTASSTTSRPSSEEMAGRIGGLMEFTLTIAPAEENPPYYSSPQAV